MGRAEVPAFINHLVVNRKVPASTQSQAQRHRVSLRARAGKTARVQYCQSCKDPRTALRAHSSRALRLPAPQDPDPAVGSAFRCIFLPSNALLPSSLDRAEFHVARLVLLQHVDGARIRGVTIDFAVPLVRLPVWSVGGAALRVEARLNSRPSAASSPCDL